jgi:hypothetical protein
VSELPTSKTPDPNVPLPQELPKEEKAANLAGYAIARSAEPEFDQIYGLDGDGELFSQYRTAV